MSVSETIISLAIFFGVLIGIGLVVAGWFYVRSFAEDRSADRLKARLARKLKRVPIQGKKPK